MRLILFTLVLLLIGCGDRTDNYMKCDNSANGSLPTCTPKVVRQILDNCKKNNMTFSKMNYTSTSGLAEVFCNPFQTLSGEKYWNTITSEQSFVGIKD